MNSEFYSSLRSAVSHMSLIILPITVYFSVLSVPIVTILFQRGAFDHAATLLTAQAFSFAIFSIIGLSIREILNKALFSMQDSRGALVGTIVLVGLNVILAVVLVPFLGIKGLALATSIANIITVFVQVIWFVTRHHINPLQGTYLTFIKCGISATISD